MSARIRTTSALLVVVLSALVGATMATATLPLEPGHPAYPRHPEPVATKFSELR